MKKVLLIIVILLGFAGFAQESKEKNTETKWSNLLQHKKTNCSLKK